MNAPTTIASLRDTQTSPRETQLPAVKAGFFDLQAFELIQRVSKAFASSDLVPKQYQGNLPNCMIAMDMAQRMGANPLMVMQNLYVVHGTPGWSAKFLIATVNVCGRYSSLRYEWRGKPGDAEYGCRAWAIERETGERLDGIWVTWAMVRAEGWDAKNGSKWKTMADQMFVYRSAAFWQRAYAPELGMGLQTAEEIHDTFDAARGNDGRFSVDMELLRAAAEPTGVDKNTGEIHDVPQEIQKAAPVGDWRPDPEEEAAIRAAEMADAQPRATASASR
ncbi:MAG TPA: hypothetical protein PLR37_17865, partial [Candidatus Accumulibacter phosphatis]|nr:hypothetical protein [Candidatus Accumulibacter phosphatis]